MLYWFLPSITLILSNFCQTYPLVKFCLIWKLWNNKCIFIVMYFNSQQLTQLISCKHVELRFNLILYTINFVYGSSSDVSVMFLLRTITKVNQSTYVPEIARWSRQCWSIVVRRHSRWVNKRFEIETWKFLLIIDTYLY